MAPDDLEKVTKEAYMLVAYYGFNKLLLKKEVIFKEDLENIPGTWDIGNIDGKKAGESITNAAFT